MAPKHHKHASAIPEAADPVPPEIPTEAEVEAAFFVVCLFFVAFAVLIAVIATHQKGVNLNDLYDIESQRFRRRGGLRRRDHSGSEEDEGSALIDGDGSRDYGGF
ncbi:hypothetical protein BDV96DRAFT_651043 [Lophiotrema nucula]|uniref:Uncharacterized protein n=1 Tax=Lophiotrema nucula TaxID=690887 RepID=A0A6A5YT75_9PLEO|nr:hypothetical protein BDV96DRAFT_651043 [Lophiotrema nucula]